MQQMNLLEEDVLLLQVLVILLRAAILTLVLHGLPLLALDLPDEVAIGLVGLVQQRLGELQVTG